MFPGTEPQTLERKVLQRSVRGVNSSQRFYVTPSIIQRRGVTENEQTVAVFLIWSRSEEKMYGCSCLRRTGSAIQSLFPLVAMRGWQRTMGCLRREEMKGRVVWLQVVPPEQGGLWVLMVTWSLFVALLPVSHLVVEEAWKCVFSFSA